jgi:hypothetical protein
MGPFEDPIAEIDPIPVGRLLTYLLRRLGRVDSRLAPLGQYFDVVGLFGTSQGLVRTFEYPHGLPTGLADLIF